MGVGHNNILQKIWFHIREIKIISKNVYTTQNYRILTKITDTYSNYLTINQFDKINW
jgi:hypothetical protein